MNQSTETGRLFFERKVFYYLTKEYVEEQIAEYNEQLQHSFFVQCVSVRSFGEC